MRKYGVITLCGSTKFKDLFISAAADLTQRGFIVLTCHIFQHADGAFLKECEISNLYAMHLQKIDMSDGIYVINKDGYIGEGTKREIEYARSKKKQVTYMF